YGCTDLAERSIIDRSSSIEGRKFMKTLVKIGRLAGIALCTLALASSAVLGDARPVAAGADPNLLVVTSDGDHDDQFCDADCTLREAINTADLMGGAQTIEFAGDYTIVLDSTLPIVNDAVTISGVGRNVTIDGNNTTQMMWTRATVELIELTFVHGSNFAGGAILADTGRLIARRCTFADNHATDGGAIAVYSATLESWDSTFLNNSSASLGAAIYNLSGVVLVRNSTFGGNTATSGAAIYAYDGNVSSVNVGGIEAGSTGPVILIQNIIANSTLRDCKASNIITKFRNLIEDGTCSPGFTGDPNLAASAADNGGPTWTFRLQSPSIAIDAGDDSVCASYLASLDQRGATRQAGAHCDLGSYEAGALECGNLIVEDGEDCEDGNLASGDCCS